MEKRPLASSKLRAIRVSISFANSSNENSKRTDSVCGGRVRVIGGRYGDLRDQDGRASDGESNWVELHGLTSFSGNGLWIYAIGLLCAVLWRPLALPLRSSCTRVCVRIFAIPPLAEMSSSMTVIKNYLTLRRCFFMMNLSRPAGLMRCSFFSSFKKSNDGGPGRSGRRWDAGVPQLRRRRR